MFVDIPVRRIIRLEVRLVGRVVNSEEPNKHHVLLGQHRISHRAAELLLHVRHVRIVHKNLHEVVVALVGLVQLKFLELQLNLKPSNKSPLFYLICFKVSTFKL